MRYLVDLGIDGLKILQDSDGYSFSEDSVLLANLANVRTGDNLLDLGAGCGILSILAMLKAGAGSATLIDVSDIACDLARKNLALCKLDDRAGVFLGDVKDIRALVPAASFDAVICNPPYFEANPKLSGAGARDVARRETSATLTDFVAAAAYALKNKGVLNIVVKASRLAELISCLVNCNLQPKLLTLVLPKPSQNADIAIVRATKGGGKGLEVKTLVAKDENGVRTAEYEALYTEYSAHGGKNG